MIVQGLITDRSQYNISRRNALSEKGWNSMTAEEQKEWLGDPLDADGANLFSCGPYYSSAVDVKYYNQEIVATTSVDGTYLYAISIIGKASDYENKVFTLSAESMVTSGLGTPQMAVYWHDDNGYEYAGATLLSAGSVTFNTTEWQNTNHRGYLAVYIYVTTFEMATSGETVRFGKVMLTAGAEKKPYVPYTEILATPATKGAYNYSDLNRVERSVAEISDKKGLGLQTKTNWTMWDIPTSDDMLRYINNIRTIAMVFGSPLVLPETMDNLTYETTNTIELILGVAYESL